MTPIPTIQQIYNNILNNLQAEFSISVNPFGDAFLMALSAVLSGIIYLVYLALGDVQKNIWFDTADSVKNGGALERFGLTILNRYPFAATSGQYTATVTGTAGAVIPATTVYKSDDTSESPTMLFQISAAYTLTGAGDVITINALTGGFISRLAVGNTLTVTSPLANVNPSITVLTETVTPIDAEDTELYRQNITEKAQLQPGSWSAADYRIVGTGIAGVGQTYAYATSGQSGDVSVFLEGTVNVAYPGPSVSPTVLASYQTALELVRPLGVFQVFYAACPINNVDVTISMGTFATYTAAQQALILSALQTFVDSVHPFIAACDVVANRNDVIATYNLSTTISSAVPGYGFSAVTFVVAGAATNLWRADIGNIPYLNSVSYVA